MTCADFLDRYSDFRDGVITAPRELRRFERHLAACAECRDYDAAVRRGVMALQTAETIEPSPDFRRRLDLRLAEERSWDPSQPVRSGRLAATLFLAAAVALFLLEGIHRPAPVAAPALPPVAFPKPVVRAGLPLVSFQDPRTGAVMGNPNPYGTALVQPASARR
ncbi:MAG TPA: anti-sigma factor [Gemmatimonadales bacterium]|nr:anti-sigma factor [Gemmatimonadales bacterium]